MLACRDIDHNHLTRIAASDIAYLVNLEEMYDELKSKGSTTDSMNYLCLVCSDVSWNPLGSVPYDLLSPFPNMRDVYASLCNRLLIDSISRVVLMFRDIGQCGLTQLDSRFFTFTPKVTSMYSIIAVIIS